MICLKLIRLSTNRSFFFNLVALFFLCGSVQENLFAVANCQTLPNYEIELLVIEGIDSIYDSHSEKYRISVLNAIYSHNSYKTGSPEQQLTSFASFFLSKLSKLGKEMPFSQRKLFWDYTCVILTNKIFFFMDSFKENLSPLKPQIEDYIKKECRTNGVFG